MKLNFICLLALAIPLFPASITGITATASASYSYLGDPSPCAQTAANSVFCSGNDVSVDAYATAAFLNLNANVEGESWDKPALDSEQGSASASASYSEMVEIDGGQGAGQLTVEYLIVDPQVISITQGDISGADICGKTCILTSDFTYGVPFEMAASISPVSVSIYASRGDGQSISSGIEGWIMSDQDGNPVSLQIISQTNTDPPTTIAPESSYFWPIGLVLGIAIWYRIQRYSKVTA